MTTTPHKAAKKFLADHSNFNGVILIQSLSPAGRGGWKLTAKNTYFFVRNGNLKPKKFSRANSFREWKWNGLCPVCNVAYPDQIVGFYKDSANHTTIACGDCVTAHSLRPLRNDEYATPPASKLMTYDSFLFVRHVYRFDVLVDVRNTQCDAGYEAQIVFIPRHQLAAIETVNQ